MNSPYEIVGKSTQATSGGRRFIVTAGGIGGNVPAFDELPVQKNMPGGHDELWWRSNFYRIASMKETWQNYLKESERNTQVSTGGEQRKKMARHQLAEAEKIYAKLERFASKNAVPNHWRQRP